ncbi:MAG: YcnI family protein [Mycobacterium sp.]|nr:YcnI family protein [Mycobacterium sp.]
MAPAGRRRWRVIVAIGAGYLGAAAAAPSAWAHIHASADTAVRGAMAIVTFRVPNESEKGATTTALTVTLPDVGSARAETMPGWAARLDRDAASGTIRSVTWTAAPHAGIGVDQFALFRISVQLPDTDNASFPATHTYSDGSVVKWDQPPLPGGGEPQRPAPVLSLAAGPAAHGHGVAPAPSNPPDNTARLLAGAALVLTAVGVGLVLLRRRA